MPAAAFTDARRTGPSSRTVVGTNPNSGAPPTCCKSSSAVFLVSSCCDLKCSRPSVRKPSTHKICLTSTLWNHLFLTFKCFIAFNRHTLKFSISIKLHNSHTFPTDQNRIVRLGFSLKLVSTGSWSVWGTVHALKCVVVFLLFSWPDIDKGTCRSWGYFAPSYLEDFLLGHSATAAQGKCCVSACPAVSQLVSNTWNHTSRKAPVFNDLATDSSFYQSTHALEL